MVAGKTRGSLPVVVLALVASLLTSACELDRRPLGTSPDKSAATTASSATKTAAPKDTRSAKLARLFTGLPSQSVMGYRLVNLPEQSGLEVREPPEWKTASGRQELRLSRDEDVVLLARTQAGPFELKAANDAAKKVGLTDVAWGDPIDGQLGARRLPGKMSDGMALLYGDKAEVWYFALPLDGDQYLLVVAAVKRQSVVLRAALLDCLKSVRPKR